jgi:tetraacyldisaccharide 4'-kinase
VRSDGPVESVGDEALWLVRTLAREQVAVFVGAPRQAAVALAAQTASVVIVDGLLQTRPRRLALSLLTLDGAAPWGSERCPPAGDLRALRSRLLAACDAVLLLTDPAVGTPHKSVQFHRKTAFSLSSELTGAWTPDGHRVSLEQLRELRLGLLLAVARPERIRSALAARGIEIRTAVSYGDHAALKPPRDGRLDAWLTTAKCATKVAQIPGAAPVWTLDHRARLPADLLAHAAQFAPELPVVWCAP